jgi:hypothetical protein
MNAVVALLSDRSCERGLAAGFEEEGVPLAGEHAVGDAEALAREAAARSALGVGVGGDAQRLVLVLAAAPHRPYLDSPIGLARAFGHAAARITAHRPLAPR